MLCCCRSATLNLSGLPRKQSHETIDLKRLQEDRNLCAHPAFVSDDALFSPTPELARAHITHAILHLLSRPPVQGKQLISRFDRDLKGGSFPNKLDEIEVVLRQNYLAQAKPGSVVSMIKALAKALVGAEVATYKGKEDQVAFSLASIGRIAPGPFEEHLPPLIQRLGRELDDGKVLGLCRYVEGRSIITRCPRLIEGHRLQAILSSSASTSDSEIPRVRIHPRPAFF